MRKADRVTQDLMSRIVSGELEIGSLLPKESELAAHYDVNRSVIREAIKLLEVHRLVHPVRRRGTEVLDPIESLSAEVLATMVMPRAGQVDREMLVHLLEVRAHIDIEMTGLAAERRAPQHLDAMRAQLEQLRERLHRPTEYTRALWDFSLIVARATGNPIYEMMIHWVRRIVQDLDEIFLSVRMASPPHLQGLQLFVELVGRRDVEGVRRLVRAFHQWATPRLLDFAGDYNAPRTTA